MSTIKVNNIQSRTGNAISFTSGDTITIPSGATITNNGTASGFGGGKIGLVTSTNFTLDVNITSTSLIEINSSCRLSFTPSSASSTFIFQFQFPYFVASANTGFFLNIYRDIGGGGYSNISGELTRYAGYQSSTGNYEIACLMYKDSPSTTSAVTYSPYVKVSSNTVNFGNNGKYYATLMEVLA